MYCRYRISEFFITEYIIVFVCMYVCICVCVYVRKYVLYNTDTYSTLPSCRWDGEIKIHIKSRWPEKLKPRVKNNHRIYPKEVPQTVLDCMMLQLTIMTL